jgi:hypothetical protein
MFYGSFDLFVELAMLPGIESGALSRPDMIDVVAALRGWENEALGTEPMRARGCVVTFCHAEVKRRDPR